MRTTTKSVVTHTTSIFSETKRADGGRSLLLEAFDLIHEKGQVGRLVVDFGTGGSIGSLRFEESKVIRQNEIEFQTNGTGTH